MDKDDGSFWMLVWEIVKWVLAALGLAVSTAGAYLLRVYGSDRARLNRHDELHSANAIEFAHQKTFREDMRKGPMGHALANELKDLHRRDRVLSRRITEQGKEIGKKLDSLITTQAEIKTHLEYLRDDYLGKKDHDHGK